MKKLGEYILLDKLRAGGMAEVYIGVVPGEGGFRKLVALKRILPEVAKDQNFERMLTDEARLTAQLSHASIAQTLSFGRQDGELFLAMEYIAGRDLRSVQLKLTERQEKMPHTMTAYIMQRVCEALDYAHKKTDDTGKPLGIVHRDVSPTNVLVSFEGEVKLIDFGVARAKDRLVSTRAGLVKGKVRYMAPEHARAGQIDGRADIFSAGVVLWELLTGRNLFQGDSDIVVLAKVREANFPKPTSIAPEAPWALEKVAMKALSKDPKERYQTGGEMAADLGRWLALEPEGFSRENLSELMLTIFPGEIEKERAILRKAADMVEIHGPKPAQEGRVRVLAKDAPEKPPKRKGRGETNPEIDPETIEEAEAKAPPPPPPPPKPKRAAPASGPRRPPPGRGPRRPPPSAGRKPQPEPDEEDDDYDDTARDRRGQPAWLWWLVGGTAVGLVAIILVALALR